MMGCFLDVKMVKSEIIKPKSEIIKPSDGKNWTTHPHTLDEFAENRVYGYLDQFISSLSSEKFQCLLQSNILLQK
jgi:hypothetical protein